MTELRGQDQTRSPLDHKRSTWGPLKLVPQPGVLATAILGDPQALVLDEPVNGLDPDGVLWIRRMLVGLAGEGRTVFLSSHLGTAGHPSVRDAADRLCR